MPQIGDWIGWGVGRIIAIIEIPSITFSLKRKNNKRGQAVKYFMP